MMGVICSLTKHTVQETMDYKEMEGNNRKEGSICANALSFCRVAHSRDFHVRQNRVNNILSQCLFISSKVVPILLSTQFLLCPDPCCTLISPSFNFPKNIVELMWEMPNVRLILGSHFLLKFSNLLPIFSISMMMMSSIIHSNVIQLSCTRMPYSL